MARSETMRIAVVSDTHFGDDLCLLVRPSRDGGAPAMGPAYPVLRDALGRVDYLVLLGDVIDLSIASYEAAYRDAKAFFTRVQDDGLAGEIVYVPGNHDFDIWSVVEHQVNVINQLKQGGLPRPFRRSVPGVLDAREKEPRLRLPDVPAHPEWKGRGHEYGGLFLDHITLRPSPGDGRRGEGERTRFLFAYPNLYLVTAEGESLLLTHGHYFEAYWTALGEWALQVAGDDLGLETAGELSVKELVGVNFPLHQLACSGIGQARPLSALARRLQLEVAAGRLERVERYLERLEDALVGGPSVGLLARLVRSWLASRFRSRLVAALRGIERTRFSREFMARPAVRERVRRYFRNSLAELARLRRDHGLDLPVPGHVVFGHTHQPIPWGADELTDTIDGHAVRFCNTGGWLLREDRGGRDFVGAEVFVYETGEPPRTVSIRAEHLGATAGVPPSAREGPATR
jgi:UDP-2,3-diacylglucosamine pyrophosphatase LpxH